MKNRAMVSLLAIVSCFLCHATSNEKAQTIAREMHRFGSSCQNKSSEDMKALRLQFLNNNKAATVNLLIDAIKTPIDGRDIITLLRETEGHVCHQCADLIIQDKELGEWAIGSYLGWLTIGKAMATGQLS